MKHSWQSEFLSKLEVVNTQGGDVAVCGSFSRPDSVLATLDDDRVAFVAPLRSRADLESLLRGLAMQPQVRQLVLAGDDREPNAQALSALWEKGLDEDGRIAGGRGLLSPELDSEWVAALRGAVELCDQRGRAPAEVSAAIAALPSLPPERAARDEAEVAIPERQTYLSRKTTFPIFTTDVGDGWLQLLNLVLRIGTEKQGGRGERLAEALNAIVTVELSDGAGEHPPFFDFTAADFDRYEAGNAGRSQLHGRSGVDQLEAAVDRLKQSLDTDSGSLVLLDADELRTPNEAPALVSATFNVVEDRLYGSFVLRNADVYGDWPLAALSLERLQREVAKRLGVAPGTATFMIHSARLHARDWDRASRVLQASFKRPLPLQVDPSGIFLFGNDGGEARAMLLDHDASTIFWEEAFADPEDLSWYIIDTMPWLLPQHIRYVGQECAALMRAMRESECYVQG
jgi:thymidylate synthase